jgi:hypothetical protein
MGKKIDMFFGSPDIVSDIVEFNNYIYVLGVGIDTSINGFNTYLLKLNLDGDSIYSEILNDTLISTGTKFIIKDNKFYITQWIRDNPSATDVDVRILKIDTLGNIIDEWIYGGNEYDEVYDLKLTEDGGFILGGTSSSYSIDGNKDFIFIKLDSLGNVDWQNTYGNLNEETIRSYNYLASTIDNGYLMLGEEDVLTPFFHQRAVILKVDSVGNQMWRKNIALMEQTYAMSLREWQDGSIIITGNVFNQDTIIPMFNSSKSYLLKLSSDGQTEVWRRYFSNHWLDSDEYTRGMILTSNGGILNTGYVSSVSVTRNDAWIVKFDSCGYTTGDIPIPFFVVDSINNTKESATVFITEQSQDYCTAEIDWGDDSENSSYYAYENNLPTVEKQFEHTFTENGTYTIKTTTLAGEEYRSYEVEIVVNGISVGVEDVTEEEINISLFPNPSNDYIIVENLNAGKIPNQVGYDVGFENSELKMSLYNLNGKQIQTINLNPKLYQQKIDVSGLTNGVYFVKFSINNEMVSTEKLVIAR